MSELITNILVSNFRGVNNFSASISNGMLIVIGQNDVGKSSVLQSLRIFFEEGKMEIEDFPKQNTDAEVEIEVHIDTNLFPEYLYENVLKLKQVYKLVNSRVTIAKKIFCNAPRPTEEDLNDYRTLKSIGTSLGFEFPSKKPNDQSVEELKQEVIKAINTAPECQWIDASEQWNDFKQVFPEVIYIPASQDHDSEQKMTNDSSVFGKLFRVGIKKWLKTDTESKVALQTIENKVEEVNAQMLRIVEQRLKEQLPLAEGLAQKIDPLDISKGFSFSMYVKDAQGIETPLNKRGSGLQRSVLIAAIRAQNDLDRLIEEMESSVEGNDSHSEHVQSLLYIVEEPEAFLHLAAQKELFYSLKDLTHKNSQVILTTHSTLFIDESNMEDIVLLVRQDGKTFSLQHIPDEQIRDELGENIRVSELITGKVCCIVEGRSDKFAFEAWLLQLGYNYRKLGIHFIPMDGCTNAEYFANTAVLVDFNVPFLVVLDTDTHNIRDNRVVKKVLEEKYSSLRAKNAIKLLTGELENYFNLDVVSKLLNIPKQYIVMDDYFQDPKAALEHAKSRAIADGLDRVKIYTEGRDARKIASQMTREQILEQTEIVEILHTLVKLAGGKIIE